jgi:hypothetical protein
VQARERRRENDENEPVTNLAAGDDDAPPPEDETEYDLNAVTPPDGFDRISEAVGKGYSDEDTALEVPDDPAGLLIRPEDLDEPGLATPGEVANGAQRGPGAIRPGTTSRAPSTWNAPADADSDAEEDTEIDFTDVPPPPPAPRRFEPVPGIDELPPPSRMATLAPYLLIGLAVGLASLFLYFFFFVLK